MQLETCKAINDTTREARSRISGLEAFVIPPSAQVVFLKKNKKKTKKNMYLKVPKCENFYVAFFALINPIWECDLGTRKKFVYFED
jgi:hypothetical protein